MHHLPTCQDLDLLGRSIAEHGFDTVADDVAHVVDLARAAGADRPALSLITDRTAPLVARQRAWHMLASKWSEYRTTLEDQCQRLHDSINELLKAWNHHEDLRATHGSLSELALSRQELDRLRLDVARLRTTVGV